MLLTLAVGSLAAARVAELGEPADLTFTAAVDGSTEHYIEMLPQHFDAGQPADVLIGLHGHGSDRWQYAKGPLAECGAARDFAAAHGMIFISPDYRASMSWMGPKAEADLVQLIALLRHRHKVRQVYLAGASMGGTSVLIFAALHPELIAGVSSLNGTANMVEYKGFADAIAASYGGTKQQQPAEYKKRSPELHPERLSMPVAFAVGGQDTIVPSDSVRRLAAHLKQLGREDVLLIDRTKGGHSTSYDDAMKTMEFVFNAAPKGDRHATGKLPTRGSVPALPAPQSDK